MSLDFYSTPTSLAPRVTATAAAADDDNDDDDDDDDGMAVAGVELVDGDVCSFSGQLPSTRRHQAEMAHNIVSSTAL